MSPKDSRISNKPPSCPHLIAFRSHHGPKPFHFIHDCLRFRPISGTFSICSEPPSEIHKCGVCSASGSRLYACLSCAAISCHLAPPSPSHAVAHATSSPGHEIAVDVDRAELFCCACCDQVYDCDFDAAVILSSTYSHSSITENSRKRRRLDYTPWNSDAHERVLVESGSKELIAIKKQATGSENGSQQNPSGLRGLNNLGNTCFMNSVLQALLHTPPLRNHFLSNRHNRHYCQTKNGAEGHVEKASRVCLSCDMDAIYSAVFAGDTSPYSPAKFLYSWWHHAANLASYEQQDAHEFFISMLDGIHENAEKEKRKNQAKGHGECCVAHRVFSGILRSDVMCMSCGFTSTTYDPCVDVSLELEPHEPNQTSMSTLIGCLDRFTRPERLGSDQKFFCQNCQVRQESLKQMSIRKLPLVSCFHIKRFEHSSVRKMSRKVDKYLQFPFSLDMAPYLSSSIVRRRFGNRVLSEAESSPVMSSEFELFAVITHAGKLDAGHYVTYLRLSNKWYKCDDAWITQVNESIVRAAQGYMMFYVQSMLYYNATEK